MSSLLSSLAVVVTGLNDSTRFAWQFVATTVYINSVLNLILYCWKIKELKVKVIALLKVACNLRSNDMQQGGRDYNSVIFHHRFVHEDFNN